MLNLPFYYESRGFWELSRCARDPDFSSSSEFRNAVDGEASIAKASAHLFTLNRHMVSEWISRDVSSSKISIIPNGLHHVPSEITQVNQDLLDHLGLVGSKVIAYVGSFSEYEGLEDLIRAFAVAVQQGLKARLLFVGSLVDGGNPSLSCQSSTKLKNMAEELGVAGLIIFVGRVDPDMLPNYYSFIDLMVIPRRPELVCELVTPMKPLEAAAYGTQMLLSSVAPLADLKSLGSGVHYFEKGSVENLAHKLLEILSKPTPTHCVRTLYPGIEGFLWTRHVQPLLNKLSEAPRNLQSSFSWSSKN